MKKLSLVLAAVLLVGGISFAQTAPAQTTAPAKTDKKMDKKGGKMDKKSSKTTTSKKTKTSTTTTAPAK